MWRIMSDNSKDSLNNNQNKVADDMQSTQKPQSQTPSVGSLDDAVSANAESDNSSLQAEDKSVETADDTQSIQNSQSEIPSTVSVADTASANTESDNSSLQAEDKPIGKPKSVIKPLIPPVNKITGALKSSINWDSVPDNKTAPSNIPFSSSPSDEKPSTISKRLQPRNDEFVSFKKKDDLPSTKDPDTAILPEGSSSWQKVIDAQAQGTTSTIGDQREVLFVIRGMIERVVMKESGIVTLGRFDTGTIPNAEIDLIPYGALDRGVSRRHCKIQLRDSQLFVTDLQSTNGTFLAGVRLQPQEPTILRKGDEVLLGRLAIQILFR